MVLITEELVRRKSEHNERLISTLEELSLHQEDIERIEHLHNWCRELKILLLQSNLIARLENLNKLKRLEYLNVAINNIERIENLEGLESLNKLDLTLNFIGDLIGVESLVDNYNLKELILIGNPCVDYPHYRDYVIATLPQLHSLDCEEIAPSERLKAQRQLSEHRAVIVQRQLAYAIERDEQRIRVAEQQAEMEAQCATLEDEEERTRVFWNTKSEHCPEVRNEIARRQKLGRQKHEPTEAATTAKRKPPNLFAPCGRPYNVNQGKLPFKFLDDAEFYTLQLEVYKHLDTSQINVDVEPFYVRVTVKGKVFQMTYNEEVMPDASTVKRAQFSGHLLVTLKKLKPNELLLFTKSSRSDKKQNHNTSISDGAKASKEETQLTGVVNIKNICEPNDLPDLI